QPAGLQAQVAVAAAPGQAALQGQAVGGPVVPAQAAAVQVGGQVRGGAGAGQVQAALQLAGGARQQVVQAQRLQLRTQVHALAEAAAGLHAAATQGQDQLALAGLALQAHLAAAGQVAAAQAPAQVLQVEQRVEAGVGAGPAAGGQASVHPAVPAGGEVARVEAVQAQVQVPGQARRPGRLAA